MLARMVSRSMDSPVFMIPESTQWGQRKLQAVVRSRLMEAGPLSGRVPGEDAALSLLCQEI
jgi:hypothetical protein